MLSLRDVERLQSISLDLVGETKNNINVKLDMETAELITILAGKHYLTLSMEEISLIIKRALISIAIDMIQ